MVKLRYVRNESMSMAIKIGVSSLANSLEDMSDVSVTLQRRLHNNRYTRSNLSTSQ